MGRNQSEGRYPNKIDNRGGTSNQNKQGSNPQKIIARTVGSDPPSHLRNDRSDSPLNGGVSEEQAIGEDYYEHGVHQKEEMKQKGRYPKRKCDHSDHEEMDESGRDFKAAGQMNDEGREKDYLRPGKDFASVGTNNRRVQPKRTTNAGA